MRRRIALLALTALLAIPVFGTGFPPTVTKSFTPPVVAVNQVSILTITLTNPNPFSMPGASISDNFPAGLVNAGPFPGTGSTTCPGGFVAAGPNLLFMGSATIPANSSCTITAPVLSASVERLSERHRQPFHRGRHKPGRWHCLPHGGAPFTDSGAVGRGLAPPLRCDRGGSIEPAAHSLIPISFSMKA